jgi:GGDEF domain-containing protein
VILLEGCDADGAETVGAALQEALRRNWTLPWEPNTLSIGAATVPDDAHTSQELTAASDAALYKAKTNGRNQIASATGSCVVMRP